MLTPENQYFCDGLTEELINRLAQIPQLRVVARTSSFQFKDVSRDIREVGRLLDVSKVLEGSVRKAGNRISVTVQLINVADGCHLWSERYEGDLTDIFAIHEQIATSVQRALRMKILGPTASPATQSPPHGASNAYNHYLQGRFLWKKRTEQGLRAALDHFEEAVRIDPTFARALSGIADCHLMLGMSAAEAPERCMPKAAEAARKAVQLDESLAEAHASIAAVKNCYEWDLPCRRSRRTIAPENSIRVTRPHFIGLGYGSTGPGETSRRLWIFSNRLSSSIRCRRRSLRIRRWHTHFARISTLRRCTAIEHSSSIRISIGPSGFLGLSSAWSGNFRAAEEALHRGLELCPGAAFRSRLLGALGFVYGRWGKLEQANDVKRELERMRETSYVPSFELAQIEIGRSATRRARSPVSNMPSSTVRASAIFMKAWLFLQTADGQNHDLPGSWRKSASPTVMLR